MKWNPKENQANIIPQVKHTKLLDYVTQLERQNRLLRQGLVPSATPNGVKTNLDRSLPPELRPGNVGEINKIIWPYWFPSTPVELELGPGESKRASFTVTQEAAFILTSLVKVVHFDDGGLTTYIDPNQYDSYVNDLAFTMRDASSSREFNAQPIGFDQIGDPMNPTPFPTPMLIRENGTIEYLIGNSSSGTTYFPKLIAFGYRIRIDAYEKLLSGVTG